ncbi:hypothetical protein FRB90_012852 [Tulasnella sp. 427]|nr:hypothetical protein FRB90_012852 [Tulasnella sp. 427]
MASIHELPVEILSDILAQLPIPSIIAASQISRYFRRICQDPLLNPWRPVILATLTDPDLENINWLTTLSEHGSMPRQNFIDILSLAPPQFLLLEATLPTLPDYYWDEAINRRFLPSWRNPRYSRPKEQYLRLLWNVWHRLNTNCTTTQAWCTQGHLNVTAAYSRSYEPFAVFEELKAQSDLGHLPTQVRVLLELADIRILALGALHHPKSFYANNYAKMLLHPPGVEKPFSSSSEVDLPEPEPGPLHQEAADASSPMASQNQPQTPVTPTSPLSLELQPTRSRESTHSITALLPSVFRGRSYSTTYAHPAAPGSSSGPSSSMRGISIFRTRSLDEHAGRAVTSPIGPSSPSILSRLAGAANRRRTSLSPPPEGQVLQIEQQQLPQSTVSNASEATQGQDPAVSPTFPTTASRRDPPSPADPRTKGNNKARGGVNGYPVLRHPTPSRQFSNYPNYTSGDADTRWRGSGDDEEDGKVWAGPLLLTAQIIDSRHPRSELTTEELMVHGRFANFGVKDLFAVAPWMMGKLGKIIDGHGLGI